VTDVDGANHPIVVCDHGQASDDGGALGAR